MTLGERLKFCADKLNYTQTEISKKLGIPLSTLNGYFIDAREPDFKTLSMICKLFNISMDFLLGDDFNVRLEEVDNPLDNHFVLEIIGKISAGYDGEAIELGTGEYIPVPEYILKGKKKEDFFALRVSGDSMSPRILDGDVVIVEKTRTVDSGSVAVILYNGDEATVKKVVYNTGEPWYEMIPFNIDYPRIRVENEDLQFSEVLGKVVFSIRVW